MLSWNKSQGDNKRDENKTLLWHTFPEDAKPQIGIETLRSFSFSTQPTFIWSVHCGRCREEWKEYHGDKDSDILLTDSLEKGTCAFATIVQIRNKQQKYK